LPGLEAVSFDPLIRSLENSGKIHFGVIVDIYLVLNIKHLLELHYGFVVSGIHKEGKLLVLKTQNY
jgi:hypothetical protein